MSVCWSVCWPFGWLSVGHFFLESYTFIRAPCSRFENRLCPSDLVHHQVSVSVMSPNNLEASVSVLSPSDPEVSVSVMSTSDPEVSVSVMSTGDLVHLPFALINYWITLYVNEGSGQDHFATRIPWEISYKTIIGNICQLLKRSFLEVVEEERLCNHFF